jgi:predicted small integral membrane protein
MTTCLATDVPCGSLTAAVLSTWDVSLTCLLLAAGALALLARVTAPAERFNRAKVWAAAGLTVRFGLWFFGFLVVAGEYFAMWQSQTWNGQEAAFRITMVILGVLIFVVLPDRDTV